MLNYLRITVTALSLTACVLIVALWVRSYWVQDGFLRVSTANLQIIGSNRGAFSFQTRTFGFPLHGWRHISGPVDENHGLFLWYVICGITYIKVPHWLVALIGAGVAAMPWIGWRFSLRSLLIVTTLVAVGLGIVAVSN
jgi:hypothetical protein